MSQAKKPEQANIVSLHPSDEGQERILQSRLPKPINILRVRTKDKLKDMLKICLSHVDDTLFGLAKNAVRQEDQDDYFSAMRELRVKQAGIIKKYLAIYESGFLALTKVDEQKDNHLAASHINASDLSLVAKDALDEIVAKDSMVHRATNQNRTWLHQLALRMDAVLTATVHEDNFNLCPETLCNNFLSAINIVEISSRARLVLFKVFEEHVMMELEPFYKSMNVFLAERGILPTIESSTSQPPKPPTQSPTPKHNHGGGLDMPVDPEFVTIANNHQQTPESFGSSRGGGYGGGPASTPPIDKNHYSDDGISGTGIHAQGGDSLIGRFQNGTVASDLSQQVVQNLIERSHLPQAFQPLFQSLQHPLQRILSANNDVLSKPDHQLRKLLNTISELAMSYDDGNSAAITSDPVYQKIEEVTGRLAEGADDISATLPSLLSELNQLVGQEQRRSKLFEKRTLSAEEGKFKALKAKNTVAKAIKETHQGMTIVPAVEDIIDTAWQKVMYVTVLKYSVESKEWDGALQTLIDLITCTQNYINKKEQDLAAHNIMAVKRQLSMGFDDLLIDSFEQKDLLQQLDSAIIKLQKKRALREAESKSVPAEKPNCVAVTRPAVKTAQDVTATVASPSQHEAPETTASENKIAPAFIQQAKRLSRGIWFDLAQNEEKPLRCRLAAIIGEFDNYIFVNRTGSKVAGMPLTEVALALQTQRLQPLDFNQLFDRSLEQVIVNMRRPQ